MTGLGSQVFPGFRKAVRPPTTYGTADAKIDAVNKELTQHLLGGNVAEP